jgi:hypothetical protein
MRRMTSPRVARWPDSGDWARTGPAGPVGMGAGAGAAVADGGMVPGAAGVAAGCAVGVGGGAGVSAMTATRRPRAMAARLAEGKLMPTKLGMTKALDSVAAEELRRRLTTG